MGILSEDIGLQGRFSNQTDPPGHFLLKLHESSGDPKLSSSGRFLPTPLRASALFPQAPISALKTLEPMG